MAGHVERGHLPGLVILVARRGEVHVEVIGTTTVGGRQPMRRRGRILSRPSVELMTTDHLTPAQKAASELVPGWWAARGWGFGVAVVTARDHAWATPGRYGWDGGYGTSWASDPKEDLIAILMTQRLGFPLFSDPYLDFWASTYQAIDD